MGRRLAERFPEGVSLLRQTTGRAPIDYLLEVSPERLREDAERAVALRLEYAPLTESQWAHTPAAEAEEWRSALKLRDRLDDLVAAADPTDPGWLALILECGAAIDFRPVVAEAVAPYVEPSTPETRDLTPSEAREALERDWLHQADGNPSPERIRQEIGWASELAARIESAHGDVDFADERAELAELARTVDGLEEPSADLYFRVREVKRRIALANPVVDFDSVLFVDMPYPQGSEWPHETRHRLGYMAVPGARLMVLKDSGEGHLRNSCLRGRSTGASGGDSLLGCPEVLFCFKPHNEKSFHLYEIRSMAASRARSPKGPMTTSTPSTSR